MTHNSARNSRRFRAASVAAASVVVGVAGIAFVAPQSQAALVTTCIGSAGAVTVPGDLVVPAGESCELSGTIVEGTTTVRKGADLVLLDGAELRGAATVQADGLLASEESTLGAALNLRSAFGGYLVDSTTAGVVDARGGSYLYSLDSEHADKVVSRAGELYLDGASVEAAVTSQGDTYADFYNSTITGALTVAGVTEGSLVCLSEVDGNAAFRGSAGDLQLGAESPLPDCGFNVFGGNLAINTNTGDIQLSDNVVRGNLVCDDNTLAPVGEGNRIRGEATGQCAEIAAESQAAASKFRAGPDRADKAEAALEARLDQAEQAVTEAGSANIG